MIDVAIMPLLESELLERLLSPDDEVAVAARCECLEPEPIPLPSAFGWRLRDGIDLVLDRSKLRAEAVRTFGGLASQLEHRLRRREFERRQDQHPDWPRLVSEGDSWFLHPFVDDTIDHLLNTQHYQYNVLCVAAAGDVVASMRAEQQYVAAIEQAQPSAVLLSGGGNDMLAGWGELLHELTAAPPGADPGRLLNACFEPRLAEVSEHLRQVVAHIRTIAPQIPVFIHGYDYVRPGEGLFEGVWLGRAFDERGIEALDERLGTMRVAIDRLNDKVAAIAREIPDVVHVDLRDTVGPDEWSDEIHPTEDGFRKIAAKLERELQARL